MAPWITVLSWHTLFIMGVIYKFTPVWYSAKQGTMHRPTSHLAHLYTVPFLWPQEEHRWQRSWVDDFGGQCLLRWFLLRFAAAVLVPPLLLPPQNSLQHRDSQHLIPSQYQQPEYHWWLPPEVLFITPRAIAWDPQSSAVFRLLCMTGHSCRNLIWVRYECLLQW